MDAKYQPGDRVTKSWIHQPGTILDIQSGVLPSGEILCVYRVRFDTGCTGQFIERDLQPLIITGSVAGDKIQN